MARILIINGDGIVLDALSLFLSRAAHEVFTAADGDAGLKVYPKCLPDLVVLDRDIHVRSASGVFGMIRVISGKKTPILILGDHVGRGDPGQAIDNTVLSFLPKNAGLSEVLAEIERFLAAVPAAKAAASPASTEITAPSASAGLILIADDDQETRKVLSLFLSALEYEVLEAEDGAETLEMARAHKPDIILLDIAMPKKSGIEVLKELVPELTGTGFIMITGNEDELVARECLRSGAFDYVPKPINRESLAKSIKARLLLRGA